MVGSIASERSRTDEKVLNSDSESDRKVSGINGFDFGTGENKKGANALGPNSEKKILQEDDCYEELGYNFSSLKKWTTLSVIFVVQVSMVSDLT